MSRRERNQCDNAVSRYLKRIKLRGTASGDARKHRDRRRRTATILLGWVAAFGALLFVLALLAVS